MPTLEPEWWEPDFDRLEGDTVDLDLGRHVEPMKVAAVALIALICAGLAVIGLIAMKGWADAR